MTAVVDREASYLAMAVTAHHLQVARVCDVLAENVCRELNAVYVYHSGSHVSCAVKRKNGE